MKYLILAYFLIGNLALAHQDGCNFTNTPGLKDGNPIETVVNKDIPNKLVTGYQPKDMQNIPNEWLAPSVKGISHTLRKDALIAFEKMQNAIKEKGFQLYVLSAFRSYSSQCSNFKSKELKWISKLGVEAGKAYTLKSVAEPGRSQHQLGTTLDIVFQSANYKLAFAMDKTKEYKWMTANAHLYGFALSYPFADDDRDGLGYNSRTGYFYEPWHWRYIGVEQATELYNINHNETHNDDMTLDEYLESVAK